ALGAAAVIAGIALLTWTMWETSPVRQGRRAIGLRVGPRSTLYLTSNGGLAGVRGDRMWVVAHNPGSAMMIAASVDAGVKTTSGLPPWTRGASFDLNGAPAPNPPPPSGICCFYDGATDGRFNYAPRADATLLAPIGSRPLAPPALYQFDRDWSAPRLLFPLSLSGYYSGVAYASATDTFWFIRHDSGDSILEEWPRDGARLLRSVTLHGRNLAGIALDPSDATLWAVDTQLAGPSLRLTNFDTTGRHLGDVDVTRVLPDVLSSGAGAEFAWMPTQE
ncbi:MAG: hypothetical protein ABL982_21985, partial [Vicinamibacterales bacterium]